MEGGGVRVFLCTSPSVTQNAPGAGQCALSLAPCAFTPAGKAPPQSDQRTTTGGGATTDEEGEAEQDADVELIDAVLAREPLPKRSVSWPACTVFMSRATATVCVYAPAWLPSVL